MSVRPFWPFAFRCLLLVVVAGGIGGVVFYRQFQGHLRGLLEAENLRSARLAAMYLSRAPDALSHVQELAACSDGRITVIAADGSILADSAGDPSSMENHARRPEVEAAVRVGHAHAVRRSGTLGVEMLYTAVVIQASGGAAPRVLRLARPIRHLRDLTLRFDELVWTSIPVVVLLGVLALYLLIEIRIARSRADSRHGPEDARGGTRTPTDFSTGF